MTAQEHKEEKDKLNEKIKKEGNVQKLVDYLNDSTRGHYQVTFHIRDGYEAIRAYYGFED